MATTGTAELRQEEAVLLAHALVARLAELAGARILFIKGATAVKLGVRPPRPSSDVDLLVDPASFERLSRELEAIGWSLRVPIRLLRHAADLAFDHSAHYIHPQWPCDLDVHYLFPGFLAPPEVVFEALWARRTTVEVAGRAVPTADVLGQGLVVGLHALRDPEVDLSRDDLALLVRRLGDLPDSDKRDLALLASATGSAQSARTMLDLVGAPALGDDQATQERLTDWQLRQQGLGPGTAWLADLSRAPWASKARVLRTALLPPREHLLGSHGAQGVSRTRLAVLHLRRWGRGVAAMPHAVAVLARRRRLARSGGDRAGRD